MKHVRSDYNGRIVDLSEPRIASILIAAALALTRAAERPATDAEGLPYLDVGLPYKEAADSIQSLIQPDGIKPIPDDEPVFLLRAQDEVAPTTVQYWGHQNQSRGGNPALSEKAFAHANEMHLWPVKKMADAPEGV